MPVYTIQFITDSRLLIPGTANVGVRGQLLEIGRGKPGANFPYRSPQEQINHYGEQKFVLLNVLDDEGLEVDHDDVEMNLSGGPVTIAAEDVSAGPEGVHDVMRERGAPTANPDTPSFQQDVTPKDNVTETVPRRRSRKRVIKKETEDKKPAKKQKTKKNKKKKE